MSTYSTVEFIIWLLLAASVVAVITTRLRIPYTVALVLGGLALGSVHLPILNQLLGQRPDWLTPDVTLIIFLPALLFEGSLKIQIRHLRENLIPILLLATLGVLAATLIAAFAIHWAIALPIAAALVFGSIVAPTDPISVLSIFRSMAVTKRLATIVEGESLFNDGTAAVLFGILVGGTTQGKLGIGSGIQEFLVVVLGGAALGLAFGFVFSKLTERIDDPQVEITLTTILAYSSYLTADSLHVSGVIATVAAGLMIGNFGARIGMSAHTRVALWSFWEYASFVINSLVFLLIGLQVRVYELVRAWHVTLLAIAVVLLGRILSVYGLVPLSNSLTEKIPSRWQHILVAGGMRGALSLALALSLPLSFPFRSQILSMTFGVVAFTIIFQGMSIRPLLRHLGIASVREDEYDRARVRRIAILSAQSELEDLLRANRISTPAYATLRQELDTRLETVQHELADISQHIEGRIDEEIRSARYRLIAAEKSSIEQAMHDGLISAHTATGMIEEVDKSLDKLGNAQNNA